jgi:soluble lytic murein transglycosylase-like protein
MMQLLPNTANLASGRKDITCEELKKNWKFSIELAAKYIHDNANVHHNDIIKVFAGYNSGYTPQTSRNGKKPALAPSSDCPGALAFECCINPGGLAETQRYVFTAIKYYKGQ